MVNWPVKDPEDDGKPDLDVKTSDDGTQTFKFTRPIPPVTPVVSQPVPPLSISPSPGGVIYGTQPAFVYPSTGVTISFTGGLYFGYPGPALGQPGFTEQRYEPSVTEVTGTRWWWLYRDDDGIPRLTGMRSCWEPGANHAECLQGYDHEVPWEHCGCGFWAYWERDIPPDTSFWIPPAAARMTGANSGGLAWPAILYPVAGVIQAWGRVRAGTFGFRAQHARITALACQEPGQGGTSNAEILLMLAQLQPQAQVYRRVAEMRAEHPTPDPWKKTEEVNPGE